MSGRLRELTSHQWARLDAAREDWLAQLLVGVPAERAAAELAVTDLYRAAGRAPPRFVWVESPAGALIAIWLLSTGPYGGPDMSRVALRDLLADPVWDAVGTRLRDSVFTGVRDGVGDYLSLAGPRVDLLHKRVTAHLRTTRPILNRLLPGATPVLGMLPEHGRLPRRMMPLAGPLRRAVFDRFLGAGREAYQDPVRDAVQEALHIPVGFSPHGVSRVHQSLCLAFADYAGQLWAGLLAGGVVALCRTLADLGLLSHRAGEAQALTLAGEAYRAGAVFWPYPQVCILSGRPSFVEVEPWRRAGSAAQRLHAPDGPALAYPDGFAVFAWHGVGVPPPIIAGTPTVADWFTEPNPELRRVIAERIGYATLLAHCEARELARDGYGTLWRIPDPSGFEHIVVVEVDNSTPEPDGSFRRYVLRVPPDQRVPRDAIGWTFGLPPGAYAPAEMT